MTSLETVMRKTPHPIGDDNCNACKLQGWKQAVHAIDTASGDKITLSEGYGTFEGHLLIASGHLDDEPNQIGPFDFRGSRTSHRVHRVGSLNYRVV